MSCSCPEPKGDLEEERVWLGLLIDWVKNRLNSWADLKPRCLKWEMFFRPLQTSIRFFWPGRHEKLSPRGRSLWTADQSQVSDKGVRNLALACRYVVSARVETLTQTSDCFIVPEHVRIQRELYTSSVDWQDNPYLSKFLPYLFSWWHGISHGIRFPFICSLLHESYKHARVKAN